MFLKNAIGNSILKRRIVNSSLSFYSTKVASAENECIFIEQRPDGIVEIKLNRPERKNSLCKKLLDELESFLQSSKSNRELRCVIFRSMVPGIFCAGADLKERIKMQEHEVAPFVARARSLLDEITRVPVPCIAAIDGVAFGGGLELALACDFRIASSTAKMGLVETKLAIIPGAGGTQRLPRLIGVPRAKELIFTGRAIDGAEAEMIGLVNYNVQQNSQGNAAYEKALAVAQEIVKNGPVAVRMAKIAIDNGSDVDMRNGLRIEELCYAGVIPTKDRTEGLNSFLEKRKPKYIGE